MSRDKHRDRSAHKGEDYVKQYRLDKRINQCLACQARGYKPDLPIDGHYIYTIRKNFKPLALDENGLCDICSRFKA